MLMENDYLKWCGGSNPSFPVHREMAKLVDAIDAKMYLDNFSLWRTILIGKEVDYYSTGRNPLGFESLVLRLIIMAEWRNW